jgi:beta-xylosidase
MNLLKIKNKAYHLGNINIRAKMKKRLTYLIITGIGLLFFSCNAGKNNKVASINSFEYQNPITEGIDSMGLRDCQVLRDGDWWYLTGTAYPHWEGAEMEGNLNKGVPLYKSKNLTKWEFVKYIVQRPTKDKWYYRRFWAPEIHKIKNKYYTIFNCRNKAMGYDWQHIGYAVADHIEGPYKVITDDQPLAKGNDLTFFEDDDGIVYAFWHTLDENAGEVDRNFGIGYAKINLETGQFLTPPKSAIQPGSVTYEEDSNGNIIRVPAHGRIVNKVKDYHQWDSAGIEGAYVIKRKGIYYLFYSSWTRGYEIGYATSSSIEGPWIKATNNPIYGATNKKLSLSRGFKYEGNDNNPFYAVGHNEIFKGVDGRLWLSCHGQSKNNNTPFLVIDPLDFDAEGLIKTKEPSYTLQRIEW